MIFTMIKNDYDSIQKLPLNKPDKCIDGSGGSFRDWLSTNNSTDVTNTISQSNQYIGNTGGAFRDALLSNNSTDVTSNNNNQGINPFNPGFNNLLGTIDKGNGLSGFDTKNVTGIIGDTKLKPQNSDFDSNLENIE